MVASFFLNAQSVGMKKHIFTLSAGRTGTAFLADLLHANAPAAEVHHEILGFESFGRDTPDISHLHAYNCHGMNEHVRNFWHAKCARITASSAPVYVETSHILMKAGLVEACAEGLLGDAEIHFVALSRGLLPQLISYHQRHDFVNVGNQWLWYLDPNYPRNLLSARAFEGMGVFGVRLWYAYEILLRARFLAKKFAASPNLHFHFTELETIAKQDGAASLFNKLGFSNLEDIVLPAPANEGPKKPFPAEDKAALEKILAHFLINPAALVEQFYDPLCAGGKIELG